MKEETHDRDGFLKVIAVTVIGMFVVISILEMDGGIYWLLGIVLFSAFAAMFRFREFMDWLKGRW